MDTGSTEPSMDDILASIQRIITDDPSGLNAARKPRPIEPPISPTPATSQDNDDVLELTSPVTAKAPDAMAWPSEPPVVPPAPPAPAPIASPPAPVEQAPAPAPLPETKPTVATTAPAKPEILVSDKAARASRDALNSLSSLLVTPPSGSSGTLEDLVRDMLRPMLKDWLDDRLPAMVEEMVAKEIARISGRDA